MSRTPIEGFPKTNGHGRRDIGYAPVSRQGNLIITASKTTSYEDLRKQLIKQIKKQKKPFGLIFDDISGGFTFTGRNTPNSYNVKPATVWKVFPDGKPDQLVRGVDMIGTPLLTFGRRLFRGKSSLPPSYWFSFQTKISHSSKYICCNQSWDGKHWNRINHCISYYCHCVGWHRYY